MQVVLEDLNLANAEKQFVSEALAAGGSIAKAAKLLGITRHAVKRRIVKYNIQWERRATENSEMATALMPTPPAVASPAKPVAPPTEPEPIALRRAERAFSWLVVFAPRRVWSEEVGDALETIAAMDRAKCPGWKIWLKVCSTIIWVLVNGMREVIAGLIGRKSPHS